MADMTGGWVSQGVEEEPRVYSSAVVGGVPYLVAGRDGSADATVIECNSDGSFTEYSFPTSNLPTDLSIAVAGTKLVMTEQNVASTTAYVVVFDTVAKSFTRLSIATPSGISGPRWSRGALGSDGLVYFPPARNDGAFHGLSMPLVYDPATNGLSFTNFGGTWTSGYGWHGAVMGGDGYLYFLPGYRIAGGGNFDGNHIAMLDFSTMTVSTISLPAGEMSVPATVWAVSTGAGLYMQFYWDRGIYKLASGVLTLLSAASPYEPGYDPSHGVLTDALDVRSGATTGADGKVYAVGSTFRTSSSFTPGVVVLNPADDSVHFQEFTAFTGHRFTPTVAYPFDGGVVSFSLYAPLEGTYPDAFFNSLYVSGTPMWSFAVGAVPVSLAVGAVAVSGSIG